MSKVINSALELIGNTPLLNASRYAKNAGIEGVTLLTKLASSTASSRPLRRISTTCG